MSLPLETISLTCRFIQDAKFHKKDFKLTKDSKSHKKTLKDRVAKRISEKQNQKTVVGNEPQEFSIPNTKTRKIPQLKKQCKVMRENLFDAWEDIENGASDAVDSIKTMKWDNVLAGYSEFAKEQEAADEQAYYYEKNEIELNDSLVPYEIIYKQQLCQAYEDKLELRQDMRLTYDEYQEQCKKNREIWARYKKQGLTRQVFDQAMEYEKTLEALRRYNLNNVSQDLEYYHQLCQKIQEYEDTLDQQADIEQAKMNDWFANFAENNPAFVQKIQERNYKLISTVFEAMQ